jgi:uncharacterized membrane protein YeaQ/YmgE (transglycosylase-associated protein family)
MHIIGFLIFGLIVGLLARALYPGKQSMGFLATAVLGMIGSLIGGLVGHALWGGATRPDGSWGFTPGGWIMSILGAMLCLWVGIRIQSRRGVT